MSWTHLASWWLDELAEDDAYESVVTPLLLEALRPEPGHIYLDLGSGEGRLLRGLEEAGVLAYGIEINSALAAESGFGTVVADLGNMPIRDNSADGAYATLVLEHMANHKDFFAETARVTRRGGVLAVVMNHPVWTAPESTPITDSDGEILWRPGDYFSDGTSEIPAGEKTITFHHRSMSSLLNAAAEASWSLEHMIEQPHHEYGDQSGIPRLLACRWSLLP